MLLLSAEAGVALTAGISKLACGLLAARGDEPDGGATKGGRDVVAEGNGVGVLSRDEDMVFDVFTGCAPDGGGALLVAFSEWLA